MTMNVDYCFQLIESKTLTHLIILYSRLKDRIGLAFFLTCHLLLLMPDFIYLTRLALVTFLLSIIAASFSNSKAKPYSLYALGRSPGTDPPETRERNY